MAHMLDGDCRAAKAASRDQLPYIDLARRFRMPAAYRTHGCWWEPPGWRVYQRLLVIPIPIAPWKGT